MLPTWTEPIVAVGGALAGEMTIGALIVDEDAASVTRRRTWTWPGSV